MWNAEWTDPLASGVAGLGDRACPYNSAFRIPQSAIGAGGGAVKYFVTLSGRTFEIDVEGGRVLVGGEAFEAHIAAVPGTPLHHLLLAGASWTISADPGDGTWVIGAVGERFAVDVVDERTRQIRSLTGGPPRRQGDGIVAAPMPGMVVRVDVTEG